MGFWSEILERSVAGTDDAPHLAALRLPRIDHWERAIANSAPEPGDSAHSDGLLVTGVRRGEGLAEVLDEPIQDLADLSQRCM